MGVLSNETLQNFQNFQISGMVIKKQTYFHYKFVNQLMTINKKHKFLSKLFDELGFLDESIFKIEYEYVYNKNFVYNKKFDDMPDLEDEFPGGNLYKKNRKYKKK
jgi:hypothetical protein